MPLFRLLQLSSSTLPVGGYSYSSGLESAVEKGWINSSSHLKEWLSVQMTDSLSLMELPIILLQMNTIYSNGDDHNFRFWNQYVLASRETKELRLTEVEMGRAISRLLDRLEMDTPLKTLEEPTFITGFATAAATWRIQATLAASGYLWSWLENQIMAAIKTMRLGQSEAQELLGELLQMAPACIEKSTLQVEDKIGSSLPGLAMASAHHETQYSRIFRS